MRRGAVIALVVVLTAGGLGSSLLVPSPSASAGSQTTRPGAIPLPEPLEPNRLEVVDQTNFVGPGSTFTVGLRFGETTPETTVTLALHQPVANRIQFGATLGGDALGAVVQRIGPVPVRDLPTEVAPDGEVSRLRFIIPGDAESATNPFALQVDSPGVHPLTITLSEPGGDAASTDRVVTHVIRSPEAPSEGATPPVPLVVAPLVRLDATVTTEADGTPSLTPVTAARLAALVTTLAGTTAPATIQTTGALLSALAAAEPTAPLDRALAGRLLHPTWVPVSVSDLLTAGEAGFLDRQLLTGGGTARDLAGGSGTTEVWVLDAGVDPAALSRLVRLGVTGVIVPEALADPLDADRFPATLTQSFTVADADGETLPALQTDLVLTALLGSSDQPALAANRVLADLAVLAFDFPDLQRAAVLDSGPLADPRALQLVLDALIPGTSGPAGTVPLLEGRSLGGALAAATPVRGGLERGWLAEEPADLGSWPARLAAADAATASLVTTLDPASAGTAADQTVAAVNRLVLASGEAGLDDASRDRLLDDAEETIGDALAAIGIPAQGTVTLTADTGVVPVTLENGLPDPVRVQLSVVSDKLEFPEGDTLELTLAPGTNRREIAVRTRATGSFPVELDLRTADGERAIATGRLSVRSTAFSGLGLGLSVIAGLFLAVWWARHFRSARRSRQLIDVPSTTSADG